MARDEIIAKLVAAFPKTHQPPDPADTSCTVVFMATDGYNSIRALTYGEIADALAGE
jgi:hypothetical protein